MSSSNGILQMWTIYDQPELEMRWQARMFQISRRGSQPTAVTMGAIRLAILRGSMQAMGYECMSRGEGDAPEVVEVWF